MVVCFGLYCAVRRGLGFGFACAMLLFSVVCDLGVCFGVLFIF